MIVGIIILLLIIASIIATIGEFRTFKILKSIPDYEPEPEPKKDYPYKKKNLFTRSEYAFFTKLNTAAKSKNIIIFTKVRLEDFIETTSTDERLKYRGYIRSRHVDFILCDENTLQILGAVELDDPSHYSAKAQEIDNFKDELFEAVGIKLLRVKPGADFQTAVDDIISEVRPEEAAASDLSSNL